MLHETRVTRKDGVVFAANDDVDKSESRVCTYDAEDLTLRPREQNL